MSTIVLLFFALFIYQGTTKFHQNGELSCKKNSMVGVREGRQMAKKAKTQIKMTTDQHETGVIIIIIIIKNS